MKCICKNLVGGNEFCPRHGNKEKIERTGVATKIRSMGYVVKTKKRTSVLEPMESMVTGKKSFNEVASSTQADDRQFLYKFWRNIIGD